MEVKLDTHRSYMTTYRMYNDCERELASRSLSVSPIKLVTATSMGRSFVDTSSGD
jgi:hypothetical protein